MLAVLHVHGESRSRDSGQSHVGMRGVGNSAVLLSKLRELDSGDLEGILKKSNWFWGPVFKYEVSSLNVRPLKKCDY